MTLARMRHHQVNLPSATRRLWFVEAKSHGLRPAKEDEALRLHMQRLIFGDTANRVGYCYDIAGIFLLGKK